ncbi:unnamed protein product [Pleuronectes platessa]|uniref:Uncharacterized protein n=1 Tax=Pleuronectes platessa TaxID=8262 RepID=A0A9N7VJ12_PLEPL|nr:unnamed protein product [Pleuronectes platessa]
MEAVRLQPVQNMCRGLQGGSEGSWMRISMQIRHGEKPTGPVMMGGRHPQRSARIRNDTPSVLRRTYSHTEASESPVRCLPLLLTLAHPPPPLSLLLRTPPPPPPPPANSL